MGWSFLVVTGDDRQYGGNDGYDDLVDRHYSWDSTVANHKRPGVGDLCVVRDARGVLGAARIEALEERPNETKERQRCPRCDSTAFKPRKRARPEFRCGDCGSEFDTPRPESLAVTTYRAEYAGSWVAVDGALTTAALNEAYLSHSKQQAIRPLDPGILIRLLGARHIRFEPQPGRHRRSTPISGGRRPVMVQQRLGQAEFRRRLLERFGARCVISGPQPVPGLHAAHVNPFAADPRHEVAGGLLLRADLHGLFDAGLITIGSDLVVRVDPGLSGYPDVYEHHGSALLVDPDDPHLPALRDLLAARDDTVSA